MVWHWYRLKAWFQRWWYPDLLAAHLDMRMSEKWRREHSYERR